MRRGEAVGLAFAITSVIATAIQIARWLGNGIRSTVIQTVARVREQVYSNLIGLHVVTGLSATEQLAGPFGSHATGIGEPAAQRTAVLASIMRREAYVLAYIDAFWLIAWVSLIGSLFVLLLRPPPPSPLIPSRGCS